MMHTRRRAQAIATKTLVEKPSRAQIAARVAALDGELAAAREQLARLAARAARRHCAGVPAPDPDVVQQLATIAAANARRDKLKATFPDITAGLWVPVLREARAS